MCESILHGIYFHPCDHSICMPLAFVSNRHREKKENCDTSLNRFCVDQCFVSCRL